MAGDVDKVDRIKAESEDFNLNDVLPSVVSVERYKRGTKGAKLVRKNAIEAGVKEYLIAKKDDLARSLQPELKELQVPEAKRSKKEKPNEAAP